MDYQEDRYPWGRCPDCGGGIVPARAGAREYRLTLGSPYFHCEDCALWWPPVGTRHNDYRDFEGGPDLRYPRRDTRTEPPARNG